MNYYLLLLLLQHGYGWWNRWVQQGALTRACCRLFLYWLFLSKLLWITAKIWRELLERVIKVFKIFDVCNHISIVNMKSDQPILIQNLFRSVDAFDTFFAVLHFVCQFPMHSPDWFLLFLEHLSLHMALIPSILHARSSEFHIRNVHVLKNNLFLHAMNVVHE